MKKTIIGGLLALSFGLGSPAFAGDSPLPICAHDDAPAATCTSEELSAMLDQRSADLSTLIGRYDELLVQTNEQVSALRDKVQRKQHRINRLERRIHRLRAQLAHQ